ncbi:hypothetical protein ACOME3_005008 [Neoechinorhynchus agilis]
MSQAAQEAPMNPLSKREDEILNDDESITRLGPIIFRSSWTLWMADNTSNGMGTYEYMQRLRNVLTIKNSEDFNSMIENVAPPHFLPASYSYNLMKNGSLPLWEDPTHIEGGEFEFRCSKAYTTFAWTELVAGILLDKFNDNVHPEDEILGVGVSIKPHFDTIQIWHKYALYSSDADIQYSIRYLLPGLSLPYYKLHFSKVQQQTG